MSRKLSHLSGCDPPVCLIWIVSRADIEDWESRTHEERLSSQHYWRARRQNGDRPNGWWHPKAWVKIVAAFKDRCAYCGQPSGQLVVEHMVPLARGGRNVRENLAPACPSCNQAKGTKTALEYLGPEKYATLVVRHPYLKAQT